MKKLLCLVNPVSGGRAGKKIHGCIISELRGMLESSQYDVAFTDCAIAESIKEKAPEYETIALAGGDGTVFQALQGLAALQTTPKIGLIPIGTGNDLARSLGILRAYKTQGLTSLLEIVLQGKTTSVDVLSVNDRVFFTNYFGFGIDAKIAHDFNALRSKFLVRSMSALHLNKVFYGLLAGSNLLNRIPDSFQMRSVGPEGQEQSVSHPGGMCEILITNIHTYAAGALPSSKCSMDDRRFEVTIVTSVWQWFGMHLTRFFKKPFDIFCNGIAQFQTNNLELLLKGKTFAQVDGEIYIPCAQGEEPLRVSVKKQIEIIVPHVS
ncbi:MAG: diacylglycerol kinase family protein [Pseudomonadota bacterium]